MRRKLVPVFVVCLLIVSAQPGALGKNNKKNNAARLKTLQTISVEGSPKAVSYIRKNLSQETCLTNAPEESEADAILEISEVSPAPCQMGQAGMCSSISAQLLDAKTQEALWFTTDDNIPLRDSIHQLNGPYQWVLWNLNGVCCKGRRVTKPPKDSTP